ncbi:glycosyl transferase [Bacteroidia bacterium]|nr:glycosyl transferase [Bacteroidia bacterium]
MKIVYLLPGGLYNSAGMERVITIKANYLADVYNYDVSIVTTEQMGRPVFYPLSNKVCVYHLNIGIHENFGKETYLQKVVSRFLKTREYRKKLEKLLDEVRPDITITTLGGWDIEFINDLKDGSIKIGELHLSYDYRKEMARKLYDSYVPNLVGRIMTEDFKQKCKKLRQLIVLTEEEKSFWIEHPNVIVIPNPSPFVAHRSSTTKNKKAIAVGRLVYDKGFDLLVEAWKKVLEKHPEWELSIFGNGAQKETLSGLIEESGLERVVKLSGVVENIHEHYPDYSILIFPTRATDALPMVIIEAMSYGLPVVAFNISCGPKELIKDGKNGFLVDSGDVDGLTEKINELIESDDLRKAMGQTAIEVASDFKIEKVMDRWIHLFEELADEEKY